MTINKVNRFQVLGLIGKFQKGKHISLDDLVTLKRVKRVEVISEKKVPVNLDGELFDSDSAVFEMVENAVKFIVPSDLYKINTEKKLTVKA